MATPITRLLAAVTGVAACCALAGETREGVAAGAPADLMELVQWHAGFGVADGFCSDMQVASPLGVMAAGSSTALLAMHGAPGLQYAEIRGSAGSLDAPGLKATRKPARGSASARDPSSQRMR